MRELFSFVFLRLSVDRQDTPCSDLFFFSKQVVTAIFDYETFLHPWRKEADILWMSVLLSMHHHLPRNNAG